MITLLDTVGPAVLRASWQAAVLALVVMLLVRSLGERISPRWRYLLWSVVVIRLLLVATPASPWSAVQCRPFDPGRECAAIALHEADPKTATHAIAADPEVSRPASRLQTGIPSPRDAESAVKPHAPAIHARRAISSPIPAEIARRTRATHGASAS